MSVDENRRGDVLLLVIYSLAGVALPAYLGLVVGDWVGSAMLLFLCLASYSGYRMGILRTAALALGVVAAFQVTGIIVRTVEAQIGSWLGIGGLANRVCCSIGVGALVILAVFLALDFLVDRLTRHRPALDRIDRWVGFMLGVVEGGVLVTILLSGVLLAEPVAQMRLDETRQQTPDVPSRVAKQLVSGSRAVRTSIVGPWLTEHNPLQRMPVLNQLQNAARLLRDPAAMDRLLKHPDVESLADHPAILRTAELIRDDEELHAMFTEGPLDQRGLLRLAHHPGFLKILEEVNLRSELPAIARQIDSALTDLNAPATP